MVFSSYWVTSHLYKKQKQTKIIDPSSVTKCLCVPGMDLNMSEFLTISKKFVSHLK